jgi:hypothetical protein
MSIKECEKPKLKLHLGCGQTYLDEYINIDYPSSEHTVQTKSVADQYEDITQLRFNRGSVDEVRLHHVFEHFRRPHVAALVACWNTWLSQSGRIHIEVPDLGRIARVFCNPFSTSKARAIAERHLFGSHEAPWAAHYEGYDARLMKNLLDTFGFKTEKIQRKSWRGTQNIHIHAYKVRDLHTVDEGMELGRKYLKQFLVDETAGELEMLRVWLKAFESQLQMGWAN